MKFNINGRIVIGFFVTMIVVLPLSMLLTFYLQLIGTLFGFFISGFIGGCLLMTDELKAFIVGLTGSMLACLIGVATLLTISSAPAEPPELLLYIASYTLWLNLGSPINLIPIVVIIGGVGTIAGNATSSSLKERKEKVKLESIQECGLSSQCTFQRSMFRRRASLAILSTLLCPVYQRSTLSL